MKDREQFVKDFKLCFNCLKPGHSAPKCFSSIRCQVEGCGGRHHTLLHFPHNESASATSNKINSTNDSRAFFQLVPVVTYGPNGRLINTVALLDSASDVTLIHDSLAKELGLKGSPHTLTVQTLTSISKRVSRKVSFSVKSSCDINAKCVNVREAFTVDKDAFNCPTQNVSPSWEHVKELNIPDVKPSQAQILIGINQPEAHLQLDIRRGSET